MVKQTNIKSVAGVIFSPDRTQVLLVLRRDVPVWVLPGGGIEPQESSHDAIIREILEETSFTVKIERLVSLYIPVNALSKLTHLYECSILKGSPQSSAETKKVQFFPLTNLPLIIPPPFRRWINDAHSKKPFSEQLLSEINYKTLFFYSITHPLLIFRFLLARFGLPINS